MTTNQVAILVGDLADPHLRAVVDLLPLGRRVILDAATLGSALVRLTPEQMVLRTAEGDQVTVPGTSVRGWIRRIAPTGWDHGVQLGSHGAAVMASRVALLAAVIRNQATSWITPVDRLFAAENKIVQYRAAAVAGLRCPRTMIAIDRHEIAEELGDPFVLKPLGPGNFEADERQHVVYVRPQHAVNLDSVDLFEAPFLAQSVILAKKHLRIVTVGSEAWVAELDAEGLPLDWRSDPAAHHSFRAASWPEAAESAIRLATALGVGMSAQDWIADEDGLVFLDLNPGGQWLFLPDEVAVPATKALAGWLMDVE